VSCLPVAQLEESWFLLRFWLCFGIEGACKYLDFLLTALWSQQSTARVDCPALIGIVLALGSKLQQAEHRLHITQGVQSKSKPGASERKRVPPLQELPAQLALAQAGHPHGPGGHHGLRRHSHHRGRRGHRGHGGGRGGDVSGGGGGCGGGGDGGDIGGGCRVRGTLDVRGLVRRCDVGGGDIGGGDVSGGDVGAGGQQAAALADW
jgi:hypothetical protein